MINYNGIMSPSNRIDRTMGIIAVGAAVVGAGATIYAANKNAGIAEKAADDADIERKKQQGLLDVQKEKYKSMKFENVYENMENVYEDLTVNQQQAQFQSQQNQQNQANIMSNMKGAAGSSGVAGLAQALANQGSQEAQRASASIGQQESANQKATAQQAGRLQQQDRQGAYSADMTRRQGAVDSRNLVKDKTNTLMAMSANDLSQKESAHQQAQQQFYAGIGSSLDSAAGLAMGLPPGVV